MNDHIHVWQRDTLRFRFYCECGVLGHAPKIIPGQHRGASFGVVAYQCRALVGDRATGRHRCGAEAVHVTGDLTQSKCREHAATKTRAA